MFDWPTKKLLSGTKCVYERQDLQIKHNYVSNFDPLENAGHGSETQLQVC